MFCAGWPYYSGTVVSRMCLFFLLELWQSRQTVFLKRVYNKLMLKRKSFFFKCNRGALLTGQKTLLLPWLMRQWRITTVHYLLLKALLIHIVLRAEQPPSLVLRFSMTLFRIDYRWIIIWNPECSSYDCAGFINNFNLWIISTLFSLGSWAALS